MAAKKPMSKAAPKATGATGAKPPSAGAVALSRRVAKVMTQIPIPQQATVAKAVDGTDSFAKLPASIKALITAAEKGAK